MSRMTRKDREILSGMLLHGRGLSLFGGIIRCVLGKWNGGDCGWGVGFLHESKHVRIHVANNRTWMIEIDGHHHVRVDESISGPYWRERLAEAIISQVKELPSEVWLTAPIPPKVWNPDELATR